MRKGDKKKQDILASAETLFCRKGYDRTTIEDILASLHCSKGSFYHHFESKMQVLEELAMARVSGCFERFMETPHASWTDRLNGLLYHCSPFDKQDEDFLAVMLSLSVQGEGAVIRQRIDDARRRLFLQPMAETVEQMKREGAAFFRENELPMLLWESHLAFGHTLVRTVVNALYTDENAAQKCVTLLNLARFQWQRLLDVPYGSVIIVDAGELYETVQKAYRRLSGFLPGGAFQMQTHIRGL